MSYVWIRTADEDLVRADQVRQITIVGGLHVVLIGGGSFLLAEIDGHAACAIAAEQLAAAVAHASRRSEPVIVSVEEDVDGWVVRVRSLV